MRFFSRACVLVVVAAVASSCFGSGSGRSDRADRERAVHAALKTAYGRSLRGLFPPRPAKVACRIGRGGPTVVLIPGTCATRVELRDRSATVRFVETWDGHDFRGQGAPAKPGLSHTWQFAVAPNGGARFQRDFGDFPPQLVP